MSATNPIEILTILPCFLHCGMSPILQPIPMGNLNNPVVFGLGPALLFSFPPYSFILKKVAIIPPKPLIIPPKRLNIPSKPQIILAKKL